MHYVSMLAVCRDAPYCSRRHFVHMSDLEWGAFYFLYLRSLNGSPTVKFLRNKATKVLRNAKSLAVQNKIKLAKNSQKEIWTVVNKHKNKKNNNITSKIILKNNERLISRPKDIADIFVDTFNLSCNTNLAQQPQEAQSLLTSSVKRVDTDMTLRMTNKTEITNIVKNMAPKRSSGYDDIPNSIIKDNIDCLSEPLTYFFYLCLNQGIFPDQLKIAKIVPIYKKSCRVDPKNYRPISRLPILSKVLEKLLKSRILEHVHLNSILHARQFGYQKGIGTNTAIDTLMDDLNSSKTNVLLFKTTARNNEKLVNITNNEEKVQEVNKVKFLGVYIDEHINWKPELLSIEKSISSACYALRSLREELTREQLKSIYFALVESKLRYSIKLWGNSYKYNIEKAFVAQKRAIRTIVRIPSYETCKPHFRALGILTVPSLYIPPKT
ncbi:reverse transcriptase (RNA-dependent DNA polymerase) domain-containing protein [Phthorimaea operculella]|nr:reverse transcriptase (RNA-dependent DNA polymerase) domain-containing protein [Phthorimaea operculella]